ncbi:hypothetical protein KP509_07G080700 [Ceratopteris richardii]|uniref:Uncharacterized protein n=1 Tax=Ceratopteris richardii TaxID=49495 RepID=A0A8T2UCJ3_CERRI|nr:hypothetical protein KP509_07G080700 [Ceratopteris richardii]
MQGSLFVGQFIKSNRTHNNPTWFFSFSPSKVCVCLHANLCFILSSDFPLASSRRTGRIWVYFSDQLLKHKSLEIHGLSLLIVHIAEFYIFILKLFTIKENVCFIFMDSFHLSQINSQIFLIPKEERSGHFKETKVNLCYTIVL